MNLRALTTRSRWLVAPRVFVPVIVVIYVAVSFDQLHRTLARPKGQAGLVSGDAKPYLAIAETFAGGDWSMDYVAQRPHRQPLYPALLSR